MYGIYYIIIYIYYIFILVFRIAPRGEGGWVRTAMAIRMRGGLRCFWWWVVVGMVGFGGEEVGGWLGVGCKGCNNNHT